MGCASTRITRGMALATLAALLVQGCKSGRDDPAAAVVKNMDRMRAEVRTLVADEVRRASLERTIDAMQSDLLAMRHTFKTSLEELRAVNASPQTTRAELEQALDRLDAQRTQAREQLIQRHFELASLTFAAEWQALAGHERRALEAAAR